MNKNKSNTIQKKKTLQNFTPKKAEVSKPTEPLHAPIPQVPVKTVSPLTVKFNELMTLRGAEYDKLFDEISTQINDTGTSILKDRNILIIQEELLKYIKNNNKGLPSVTRLSILTKLSRVTVGKHLKDMMSAEFEEERKKQHKYFFDVLLTNVGRKALEGNLNAAKLYFDTMIRLDEKESIKMYVQNQQNNIVVSNEK